jgi:hypothetical protein
MTESQNRLPVAVGVPLNGLDEAFRLSQALAMAAVLPSDLRGKPSDVLAVILYGQELGLAPMQSLQGIYVVKGKPQMSASLWVALIRRAGHKVHWGHCDEKSASVTVTRSDDPEHPHTETFTIQDAANAGLCQVKDGKVHARSSRGDVLPWEAYTKTMLRNRAVSIAGRLQCPEVALGFTVEGDYDHLAERVEVVPPEHHGDVMDAEEVPDMSAEVVPDEPVSADELHDIAAEYAQPTLVSD